MARSKRLLAALAAGAMMFGMAGCTDTSYIVKYGDQKVNSGVYLMNMFNEMTYQMTMMYYTQGIQDGYFDQEVEGKSFSDYLLDTAKVKTNECIAITDQFDKLGLSLTDDEEKELNDSIRTAWQNSSELLEKEGISKESMKYVYAADIKREKIFDYYYGEGGVEAVTDEELKGYVEGNYIRYKSLSFPKSTNLDENVANEENEEQKKLRDEYLALANGVDFEGFDDVIDQYNAYLDEKAAEEAATDAEDTTVLPTLEDAAVESEEESVGDAADNDDDGIIMDDAAAQTMDDGGFTLETTTEEEDDPYKNEVMTNYGNLTDEDKESDTGKLYAAINALGVGKAEAYEDDGNYYIIIKGDISERSADYAAENRDSLIQTMKKDDFQAKIDSWIAELNLEENSESFRRYTPKEVYDRQQEYYEEQGKKAQ